MTESARQIYLDNNATTRPDPSVIEVVAELSQECYANPGSRHAHGRHARRALEDSRETIAEILGAKPAEVIFTSGGTESINTAIFGLTNASTPSRYALTAGEHPATNAACRLLDQRGWQRIVLEVDSDGRLDTGQVEAMPWSELRLVTLILAHNETGVIQDVGPLAERCHELGIPFHLDAVQAVGKIPVNFDALGVTALSLGAHKFHGPRGIGALILKEGTEMTPMLMGGHQEAGRRAGTEPVALIAGMVRALQVWHADREQRTARVRQLRDQLEQSLCEACPPVVINGSREHRLPNTLNISFLGVDGEALLVALDLEGIACSLGSTCASGSTEPAAVLVSMGCHSDVYRSAVRFSLSRENTTEEIDEAAARIAGVVRRLRGSGEGSST